MSNDPRHQPKPLPAWAQARKDLFEKFEKLPDERREGYGGAPKNYVDHSDPALPGTDNRGE